jgi:hypothetical protein
LEVQTGSSTYELLLACSWAWADSVALGSGPAGSELWLWAGIGAGSKDEGSEERVSESGKEEELGLESSFIADDGLTGKALDEEAGEGASVEEGRLEAAWEGAEVSSATAEERRASWPENDDVGWAEADGEGPTAAEEEGNSSWTEEGDEAAAGTGSVGEGVFSTDERALRELVACADSAWTDASLKVSASWPNELEVGTGCSLELGATASIVDEEETWTGWDSAIDDASGEEVKEAGWASMVELSWKAALAEEAGTMLEEGGWAWASDEGAIGDDDGAASELVIGATLDSTGAEDKEGAVEEVDVVSSPTEEDGGGTAELEKAGAAWLSDERAGDSEELLGGGGCWEKEEGWTLLVEGAAEEEVSEASAVDDGSSTLLLVEGAGSSDEAGTAEDSGRKDEDWAGLTGSGGEESSAEEEDWASTWRTFARAAADRRKRNAKKRENRMAKTGGGQRLGRMRWTWGKELARAKARGKEEDKVPLSRRLEGAKRFRGSYVSIIMQIPSGRYRQQIGSLLDVRSTPEGMEAEVQLLRPSSEPLRNEAHLLLASLMAFIDALSAVCSTPYRSLSNQPSELPAGTHRSPIQTALASLLPCPSALSLPSPGIEPGWQRRKRLTKLQVISRLTSHLPMPHLNLPSRAHRRVLLCRATASADETQREHDLTERRQLHASGLSSF